LRRRRQVDRSVTVVSAVIDERRTVAKLVAVDGSVVGGMNGSVWPYWTVCLDHTCLASVSITKQAAETPSYPNKGVVAPSQKNRMLQYLTANLYCQHHRPLNGNMITA